MAKGSGSDFSQAAKQQQAAAKAGKLTTRNGAQEFLSRFHGNAKGFKLPKFEMPGAQKCYQDEMQHNEQLLYSNILEVVMPAQSMWMSIL